MAVKTKLAALALTGFLTIGCAGISKNNLQQRVEEKATTESFYSEKGTPIFEINFGMPYSELASSEEPYQKEKYCGGDGIRLKPIPKDNLIYIDSNHAVLPFKNRHEVIEAIAVYEFRQEGPYISNMVSLRNMSDGEKKLKVGNSIVTFKKNFWNGHKYENGFEISK